MDRTYVVTGAASGVGAATTRWLRERGGRVIACDREIGDVAADLATPEGRARLVDGVTRLSGGRIDAIVANAGGGPAETMIAVNFFGAVATLDGLRPLLAQSPAPRAVMVSSIACLRPPEPRVLAACLALDEATAVAAGKTEIAADGGLALYASAKHALNAWCRRAAATPPWAGAGIPLNGIALGFFDTPAAAYILTNPELSAQAAQMVPLRGAYPGRPDQAAAALAWCVSPDNSMMTGQILFVDGGVECRIHGGQS